MIGEIRSWEEKKNRYEQRKPLDWEETEVGQKFEPFIFSVTKRLVKEILEVTDAQSSLSLDTMGTEKNEGIAPQAVAMIYGRLSHLGSNHRPAPGGAMLDLSFRFVKPVRIGDTITSRAVITAKEERRGKRIIKWRAESEDQNGEIVSIMEFSGYHRTPKKEPNAEIR